MNYDEMIKQCRSVEQFITYCRSIDSWHSIPREKQIVRDILTSRLEQLKKSNSRNILFCGTGDIFGLLTDIDFSQFTIIGFIDNNISGTFWGYPIYHNAEVSKLEIDAIIFTEQGQLDEYNNSTYLDSSANITLVDLFDRTFFIESILSKHADRISKSIFLSKGKTRILYLLYTVIANVVRQGIYLQKTNRYDLSLIKLNKIRETDTDSFSYNKYFDSSFNLYDPSLNHWILSKVIASIDVDIIYANVSFHKAYLPVFIQQFTNAKVVFELKDTLQTLSREELLRFRYHHNNEQLMLDYDIEQYAYKHMQGLVHKEKEGYSDYFIEDIDHNIPTLSFRSYACDEFTNYQLPEITDALRCKLIYSSAVAPTSIPSVINPATRSMLEIFTTLLEQGLEVRSFDTCNHKNIYSEWGYLLEKYSRFSLSSWMSVDKAIKLQSQYGFGIILFKDEEQQIWGKNLWNVGIGERFISYIESGIPVIVSDSRKAMCALIRKYNIGIVVCQNDLTNLKDIILNVDYQLLRNNVIKLRDSDFNMKNNIDRLEKFYAEI